MPQLQRDAADLVQIEKPIYGGAFLARDEGKAVFVPLVLPGEQARVRIVEEKRGYATAEVEEIVAASAERVVPALPVTSAPAAVATTSTRIMRRSSQSSRRSCAKRWSAAGCAAGRNRGLSAEPWHYRNRIRLAFDAQGNLVIAAAVRTRSFRSQNAPSLRRCWWAPRWRLPESHRDFAPATAPTELALFCDADGNALLATVFVAGSAKIRFDEFAGAIAEQHPAVGGRRTRPIEGRRHEAPPRMLAQWGDTSIVYRPRGFEYRVDHGAFFQVNRWLVDALVERVTAGDKRRSRVGPVRRRGPVCARACGKFERVVAVESAPAAESRACAQSCRHCGQSQ